jgi:hypothetical protein
MVVQLITPALMMEAETVSETLGYNAILTRLIAREDLTAFNRRESFKSYYTMKTFLMRTLHGV